MLVKRLAVDVKKINPTSGKGGKFWGREKGIKNDFLRFVEKVYALSKKFKHKSCRQYKNLQLL